LADAQTNLANLKAGVSADDLTAAQAKVDIAKAALNQRYVVAPFPGTITLIKSMLGDQVSNGTQAMRIDDTSTMYVDLQISEIDVDRIKLDQNATLVFDALPTKTYNGTVNRIDSVGTIASGAVNFTVTVKMTDADANVKPGMTASASIVLEQVDNVMLVPNRGIRTQNNLKYVMVLQNGVINSEPVRVGISNDTQTEVTSTILKAGDLIVTNPLSDLQKNGQNLFNALRLGGGAGGGIPGGGVPGGGVPGGGVPGGGFPGGDGGGRPGGGTGGNPGGATGGGQ
jgi:HlyD family secretion protein